MKTLQQIQKHIDSFERPKNYPIKDWRILKKRAFYYWKKYFNNNFNVEKIDIPCPEFDLMLRDQTGESIIEPPIEKKWLCNEYNVTAQQSFIDQAMKYVESDRFKEAINMFSMGLEIEPISYICLVNRGLAYQHIGVYGKAMKDYDRAINLMHYDTAAYINRAGLYSLLDLDDKALNDLNHAIKVDKDSSAAFNNRGLILMSMSDYSNAECDLKRAIELGPCESEGYLNLGLLYKLNGQSYPALEAYNKVMKFDPFNKDAIYNIGLLKDELFGNKSAAKEHLNLADSLGHEDAKNALMELEEGLVENGFSLN